MTITCVYSSGWGNTRLVVERVQELLAEQYAIEMKLINAYVAQPEDFSRSKITILACPTYDHGVLHAPFEKLVHATQWVDLTGYVYAIIWLWDNKYDQEYNIASADVLNDFVIDHWWKVIWDHLRINKHPLETLDSIVAPRVKHLSVLIKKHA